MKVAVFGLGYVGTVTAACLASHGHDVWGVDVDGAKVDDIRAGRSPVAEPGLDALVARAVADGTLHATTSCAGRAGRGRGLAGLRGHAVDDRRRYRPVLHPPLGRRHRGRAAGRGAAGRPATTAWSSAAPCPAGHGRAGRAAGADRPAWPARRSPRARRCARSSCARAPAWPTSSTPPLMVVGTSDPRVADDRHRPVRLPRPARDEWSSRAPPSRSSTPATPSTRPRCRSPTRWPGCSAWSASTPARSCRCSVEDQVLNISPAYLRPGFAFGGSCLPKDLRSLLHLARVNSADLPMLAGTLATNELVIRDVVDRVVAARRPHRRAARPELQDEHRRPAREPERRAGRAADRQGLRRPHLRPGRQPGPAGRRQPPARRGQAAAPGPAARRTSPARRCAGPTSPSSRPATRPSWTRCSAARRGT